MKNESVQPGQQNIAESKKFKLSKKHLLIWVSTVAIATAIFMVIPSKPDKSGNSTAASAVAVNQAENSNPVLQIHKNNCVFIIIFI